MRRVRAHAAPSAGFTLIELLLATGLLALLVLLVFQLFDRTLSLWRTGETRRGAMEQASVVGELMARDLRSLEPGVGGDLVAEWVRFDLDGDGTPDSAWPRVRMVRAASPAEAARLRQAQAVRDRDGAPVAEAEGPETVRSAPELVETVWGVVPASLVDKDARSEGRVHRGVRLVSDLAAKSCFAPDFYGVSPRPPAGSVEDVCGGVLWLGVQFAGQTSVVHDGWSVGDEAEDAVASWDAWNRGRPDPDQHAWNAPSRWSPKAKDRPLLPRRVRIELEIERPEDRVRRTRLLETLGTEDTQLAADDARHLPDGEGAHVLLDGEWMEVLARDGARLSVRRGARGTAPLSHAKGTMIHWGQPTAREVVVSGYREDWDL